MQPFLVQHYALSPVEADRFSDWPALLRSRKQLSRSARRPFDRVHAALARLSMLHEGMNSVDDTKERVLVAQLIEARTELEQAESGR